MEKISNGEIGVDLEHFVHANGTVKNPSSLKNLSNKKCSLMFIFYRERWFLNNLSILHLG
jgi:hypothetical protein